MRLQLLAPVLAALALTACGTTERTTVVTAPAGSTVVVPSNGDSPRVITHGDR
ncbi:MAG: hypothetical protein WDM92_14420 [Caulobacteraceae bacterium]